MEKKYYFLKLNPPRPTFSKDMTTEEAMVMKEHSNYWRDMQQKGFCPVFGPVLDPKGAYGVGIIEVENEEKLDNFVKNDPASKLCFYEFYPMFAVLPQK